MERAVIALIIWLWTCGLVIPVDFCLEHLIVQIASTHTLVVYTSKFPSIIITNATVTTVNLDFSLDRIDELEKPNLYVFVKVGVQKLGVFLGKLYRTKCWGSDVNTLFYGYKPSQISELFELSWKFFMLNVLVVTEQLEVFTYHPVSMGKCQSTRHHGLGYCMIARITFTETALKSFKGCGLRVMALPVKPFVLGKNEKQYPGYDEKILLEIMSRLKIKVRYVRHNYPDWGTKLQNGSYTNVFQEIYSGNIDLTLTTALRLPYLNDFDYTVAYVSLRVPYWTAFPPQVPQWIHLTLVFTWPMWLCLICALLLVSASCLVCKSGEDSNYRSAFYCAMNVWRSLFSSINSQPSSNPLKLVFLVWSLCCFIITSSYQGCMISALFKIFYEPQLQTLEDLVNSDLQYGGHPVFAARIYEEHTILSKKIFTNYIPCTVKIDCLLRAAELKDFAVFKAAHTVHYDLDTSRELLVYSDGSPKVTRSKFELQFADVFFVRKGSPYLKQMNVLIFRLKENGIIPMWDVYEKSPGYEFVENMYKKISLSHLFLAFIALGFGYALAVLVFIGEFKFQVSIKV